MYVTTECGNAESPAECGNRRRNAAIAGLYSGEPHEVFVVGEAKDEVGGGLRERRAEKKACEEGYLCCVEGYFVTCME